MLDKENTIKIWCETNFGTKYKNLFLKKSLVWPQKYTHNNIWY